MADKIEKRTIVEEGTSFKGTLASSCPIDVRGRIEGEIETPSLTVSESGAVHGRAKVGSVRSNGELSGEFDADSIELAGTVLDNTIIRARSFEVKLTAPRGKMQVIFGQCELSVGDEPTETVAVDVPVAMAAEAPAIEAPRFAAAMEEPALSMPLPAPFVPEPENPMLPPAMPEAAAVEMMPIEAAAAPPADMNVPPPVVASTLDEVLADLDVTGVAEGKSDDHAKPEGKKRKRKEERNGETGEHGWSQPPSQPPPAS
jgi:cytoskeletal protein CcmA (bactofilin family)